MLSGEESIRPVYITIGDGGNIEGLQTCENKFKY